MCHQYFNKMFHFPKNKVKVKKLKLKKRQKEAVSMAGGASC